MSIGGEKSADKGRDASEKLPYVPKLWNLLGAPPEDTNDSHSDSESHAKDSDIPSQIPDTSPVEQSLASGNAKNEQGGDFIFEEPQLHSSNETNVSPDNSQTDDTQAVNNAFSDIESNPLYRDDRFRNIVADLETRRENMGWRNYGIERLTQDVIAFHKQLNTLVRIEGTVASTRNAFNAMGHMIHENTRAAIEDALKDKEQKLANQPKDNAKLDKSITQLQPALETLSAVLRAATAFNSLLGEEPSSIDAIDLATMSHDSAAIFACFTCSSKRGSPESRQLVSRLAVDRGRLLAFARQARYMNCDDALLVLGAIASELDSQDQRTAIAKGLLESLPDTNFFVVAQDLDLDALAIHCASKNLPDEVPEGLVGHRLIEIACKNQGIRKWLSRSEAIKRLQPGEYIQHLAISLTSTNADILKPLFQAAADAFGKGACWNVVRDGVVAKLENGDNGWISPDASDFVKWAVAPNGLNKSHEILSMVFKELSDSVTVAVNAHETNKPQKKSTIKNLTTFSNALLTLVGCNADVGAFKDQGIGTKGDSRSLVHQFAIKQKTIESAPFDSPQFSALATNIQELINRFVNAGHDIVPYEQICKSELVGKFNEILNSKTVALFYGFEAMRTPYVDATKDVASSQSAQGQSSEVESRAKSDALRMWDIFDAVTAVTEDQLARVAQDPDQLDNVVDEWVAKIQEAVHNNGHRGEKVEWSTLKVHIKNPDQPNTCTPVARAADYMKYLIERKRELLSKAQRESERVLSNKTESEERGITPSSRASTRLCKLGLDWVCERGGYIASLLDGVEAKDLVAYGDRKSVRMFNDDSTLFEKTITYSEIRHILRNIKKFRPPEGKPIVDFYRKGKKLSEEEVTGMVIDFNNGRDARAQRKKEARTALTEIESARDIDELIGLLSRYESELNAVAIDAQGYKTWLQNYRNDLGARDVNALTESLTTSITGRNRRLNAKIVDFSKSMALP